MKKLTYIAVVLGLVVAVDQFYEHPTYGTGLKALLAAVRAGELFA